MKPASLITFGTFFSLCIGAIAHPTTQSPCPMAKDHANCPFAQKQDAHASGVDRRGDQAMGFSHEKTKHHFILFENGGAIRVIVDSANDQANLDAIRSHLKMIAGMFSAGDFSMPMFIHDTKVPGAANMRRLRSPITYRYEPMARGAQVVISSVNPKAIAAVHNFLRFQIKDHRTGDPLTVSKK